ncbi:MAG: FliM/FliN family flagellar motor switch protein [Rhizomicrobium sp.]
MSGSIVKVVDSTGSEPARLADDAPRIDESVLRGIRVTLEARLGEANMTVDEMMALKSGAVVTLESGLADHVDLFLNGTLVARGEIVAVGERFGVRIVEIAQKP